MELQIKPVRFKQTLTNSQGTFTIYSDQNWWPLMCRYHRGVVICKFIHGFVLVYPDGKKKFIPTIKKSMSQVKMLRDHLLSGRKIDRVAAFRKYGIADLRSRISNVEKTGLIIDRKTKKGKKYLEYFIKQ